MCDEPSTMSGRLLGTLPVSIAQMIQSERVLVRTVTVCTSNVSNGSFLRGALVSGP